MPDPGGALERSRSLPDVPALVAIASAGDPESRAALAERALAVHDEITAVCLEASQPSAVLAVLRRLTGGRVALLDERRTVVLDDPEGSGDAMMADLDLGAQDLGAPRSRVLRSARGTWFVVAALRAAGTAFGHLCLALAARPAPPDVVAAERGAIACALLLARGEAALVGEGRHGSELIWDLLENRVADEGEALARMTHANRVLDLPARLLLVELGHLDERARLEGWDGERLVSVREGAARGILEQFEGVGRGRAASAARGSLLAVIVPVDPAAPWSRPRRLGDLALAGGGRTRHTVTGVGVSGLIGSVPELALGYRQAQLALTATGHAGTVAVFEELGVLQFLLAPAERSDLDQFAGRVLGPLLSHDRAKGSDLLHTLEVYLDADCNIGRAANLLYVHYKTMRNRLQRIEELSHLQLDRQGDRFDAQLALKILRLSATSAPADARHN